MNPPSSTPSDEQKLELAVKRVIAFKTERGYLLNGNVSMIAQKTGVKVRPLRAKLKELGVVK